MNGLKLLFCACPALAGAVSGYASQIGESGSPAQAHNNRPNILFILADDLGWGDLSCQYAEDLSTPNIDRIFETGLRLDNFYANSNVSRDEEDGN